MPHVLGRAFVVLFSSGGQYSQRRKSNLNINFIDQTLNYAIRKAAEKAAMGQQLSRNRKLSWAGVIRLLIGADGGSLAKELHRADIDSATHKSARRHSGTWSSDSTLLARIAETFAAIVCWRWMELLSTFHAIPVLLLSFKTRALQTATINCTLIRFLTCATRRFTTRLSSRSRRRTKLAR